MVITEVFDNILTNAIDFMEKSVEDLENKPKYSIINFCSAVELFLKARLAAEHWSLIVSKNQVPNHDRVLAGEFKSVTLEESIEKLDQVLKRPLTDKEAAIFKKLYSHRNKAVHFFHNAHINEKDKQNLVSEIVKEQLTAWYYLYEIILKKWDDTFKHRFEEIEQINRKLKANGEFLKIVYNSVCPEIKRLQAEGIIFEFCPSCGFESQNHLTSIKDKPYYAAICMVCDLNTNALSIPCSNPDCDSDVLFVDEGFSTCVACEEELTPVDIQNELDEDPTGYFACKSGESYSNAYCCECSEDESVFKVTDTEDYLCSSCLSVFDQVYSCEWCGAATAASTEDSFLFGCGVCDGRFGWKDD